MKPQLIVLDTVQDIEKLQQYLSDKEYVSYDCETTGLTNSDEIIGFSVCAEEDKAYYVVLSKWNKDTQALEYLPGNKEAAQSVIQMLVQKSLIMHNAIFDCRMAESFFKIRLIDSLHTDTMILAHLLDENRRKGLKELAKSIFGEHSADEQIEMKTSVLANGGQLTKSNYELYKADSALLGKYGAQDALLTLRLFYHLIPSLFAQKLDVFFYKDESMPLLRGPTYELNTTGLQVDTKKLTALKKTLEAECAEAEAFIQQEIAPHIKDKYPGNTVKNTFNIGASTQLSWLLYGKLGLEFNTLTKGGKNICKALNMRLPYTAPAKREFIAACEREKGNVLVPAYIGNGKKASVKKYKEPWGYIACDKAALKKIAHKYKWIERLLEYQRKMKLLSTYVKGIEERVEYGVIRPSFLQAGTSSGRYSSKAPNFQNLPRDDQRIKDCIIARPGKVFVIADYSQLEPRVFAYYSKDSRLMAAFDGTSDFYSVVGIEVYDKHDAKPQKDGSPDAFGVKYKKLRDLSKVIALASAYGATPYQLAPTTGKSIDDTAEDMAKYFEQFPGVKTMMLEAHDQAKKQGFVTNLFGRPRRIPEAKKITKLYGNISHAELPYEARKLLNLSCNHRIQSTGASLINRAAIRFHQNLIKAGIECKIVMQVHDELIVECQEADADDVSLLLQDAMENTNRLEGIALEAIPRISRSLSK
jgi:DNA polymerase I-like protein with 3'-5' exonuclease and polymerase domains